MKTIIISLFILSITQSNLLSQGCLPWGIQLLNQQEIDSFAVNYPGCTEIEGIVIITGNTITNLEGLSIVTAIDAGINIFDCPNLTSIEGLSHVTYLGPIGIGTLLISNCNNLASLSGLEGLDSISGNLIIRNVGNSGNEKLVDLSGLDNIKGIRGSAEISNCDSLISLSGLHNLSSVGSRFSIFNNDMLTNLSGLESLTSVGMNSITGLGDDLLIGLPDSVGNDALLSLSGLNNLENIGGDLSINFNENLVSLIGLENISYVGGNLHLFHNDQISNLQGLESLQTIGGNIEITNCQGLQSLQGIENIQANSIEGIDISMNPGLSECNVLSICEYLTLPTGNITIENNAPGCNTPAELEEACLVNIQEYDNPGGDILVYPNPASKTIAIYSKVGIKVDYMRIFNFTGKIELECRIEKNNIDVSALRSGMYLLEIETGSGIIRKKLIRKEP